MSEKGEEEKQTEFVAEKVKPLAVEEPTKELSTKEAYFASLNEWVKHANISQNAMAMFPWYFMTAYPQLFNQPVPGSLINFMSAQNPTQPSVAPVNVNNLPVNGFGLRPMSDQAQAEFINRHGGFEYIVAPFWKRAAAEFIDMILVLCFKIVTLFIITNVFGYQIDLNVNESALNKALDDEDFAGALLYYLDILAFSSDLLAFEIATKLFVSLYEAESAAYFNGASLGKYIMGLSIKYIEAMVILPNNNGMPAQPIPQMQLGFQAARVQMRALLFPAETPNFKRAFARALAKNCILSIIFPMFFLMIFFKNNRTAYDVLTKTIVVETSSQPVLLRRPAPQQQ